MISPPSELSQVIEKLKWADKHIKNLATCVRAYTQSKPYTRVLKEESDTLGDLYEFTSFDPPPIEISLIIGDASHNLRSCINYLACALMRTFRPRSKCDRLAYPIAKNANQFFTALCNTHMDLAGEKVIKFLEAHQPYIAGYETLTSCTASTTLTNTDSWLLL